MSRHVVCHDYRGIPTLCVHVDRCAECSYMYVCACACAHACMYSYMCTCVHVCMHAYMCVYACVVCVYISVACMSV